MARCPHHTPSVTGVVLLGDHETVQQHRDDLVEWAAPHGYRIVDAFSFPQGTAAATDDLTQVEAAVAALARALGARMDVWVPFVGPDLGREQHWRRLSLVLQRHGLNLRAGPYLQPFPTDFGFSEIDFALRQEVRSVDELDRAALAAAGAETLGQEIELALAAVAASGAGFEPGPGIEGVSTPTLPAPTTPWPQRQPMLKNYVRWLVRGCGVTQVAAARVLNSSGQRTPKGRPWQPATVSALLNGRYDHGGAKAHC